MITVFSDHFPLSTQNVKHEADEAVKQFKVKFQNVKFLTPVGFFDILGNRQCHFMHKKNRPADVCYLNVRAEIPMEEFAPIFEEKTCRLEYYIRLPQSSDYESNTTSEVSSKSIEKECMQSDLYEDDNNLNVSSMFSSTSDTLHSPLMSSRINLFSSVTNSSSAKKKTSKEKSKKRSSDSHPTTPTKKKKKHTVFSDGIEIHEEDVDENLNNVNDNEEEYAENIENSNDSFDLETVAAGAPKLAAMLMTGRSMNKGNLISTYYGPLGVLDD